MLRKFRRATVLKSMLFKKCLRALKSGDTGPFLNVIIDTCELALQLKDGRWRHCRAKEDSHHLCRLCWHRTARAASANFGTEFFLNTFDEKCINISLFLLIKNDNNYFFFVHVENGVESETFYFSFA